MFLNTPWPLKTSKVIDVKHEHHPNPEAANRDVLYKEVLLKISKF